MQVPAASRLLAAHVRGRGVNARTCFFRALGRIRGHPLATGALLLYEWVALIGLAAGRVAASRDKRLRRLSVEKRPQYRGNSSRLFAVVCFDLVVR